MTPHSRSDESAFGMMPVALGHSRKRRLLIRAPETATLQWRLPVSLSAAWDEWYWTTLRGGAYEARLRVRAYGTAPEQTVIARMVEPPRFSRQFGFCDVSVNVVINPTEMGEFAFAGGREPERTAPPEDWFYNFSGNAGSGNVTGFSSLETCRDALLAWGNALRPSATVISVPLGSGPLTTEYATRWGVDWIDPVNGNIGGTCTGRLI